MNKFNLAIVAFAFASPAMAADLVEAPPAPVVEEVAVFDWTGGYLGIYKGGTWVNGDFGVPGDNAHEDFNGFTLGKFFGYNYMYENFMIGAEGDITYTWNENRYRALGQRYDVGTDWSGSLRARLGYAVDHTLFYATGGWAATRATIDGPGGNGDHTFNGWTLGAGVDWAVWDNWFVRGEYRFTNFGNEKVNGVKVDLDQNQFLIGVSYKF